MELLKHLVDTKRKYMYGRDARCNILSVSNHKASDAAQHLILRWLRFLATAAMPYYVIRKARSPTLVAKGALRLLAVLFHTVRGRCRAQNVCPARVQGSHEDGRDELISDFRINFCSPSRVGQTHCVFSSFHSILCVAVARHGAFSPRGFKVRETKLTNANRSINISIYIKRIDHHILISYEGLIAMPS